jgi:Zn-dependent protease
MVSQNGALKLFRLFGIDVYLHWTWAVAAYFMIQRRTPAYAEVGASTYWAALEYCTLFAIVLMHEFGHALACKSVGGKANLIVLWPLGGVAFVSPPHRPGAVLWSIFAGPMVNMILVPITFAAVYFAGGADVLQNFLFHLEPGTNGLSIFLCHILELNILLLIFNLMPIFPLDGGQILQSLFWFFLSYERSLMIVSIIGLMGGLALAGLALMARDIWIVIMAAFIIMQAWRGFTISRQIFAEARSGRAVPPPLPSGKSAPPVPADATTHRIVTETFDEALRRERFGASAAQRHNPVPPPLPTDRPGE